MLDIAWFIESERGVKAGNMLVAGKTKVVYTAQS
jgi:hypothetical protein